MAHPYGLTVFEDYVFWTDWNFKSIHRADKFTGNHSMTLMTNLPIQPFDIKVYSPLRQPSGELYRLIHASFDCSGLYNIR